MSYLPRDLRVAQRGRLPLLWLACLVCSLMAFAFPQAQQQKQITSTPLPTYEVLSNMVVVDVTVRDRKGNLVGDLTKDDFKVYEDNVPQQIVTFALENIPVGPPPTPAPSVPSVAADAPAATTTPKPGVINLGLNPDQPVKAEDLAGKRMVILFFDLSSLGTEDLIRSVDTARNFLVKQTGPQDLVAVATYSSVLELVQDLTNDRDLLLHTLNGLVSTDSGDAAVEDLSDQDTSDDVFVPDTTQFNIFNTDRRLSALETLAKMYRDLPEKKSLVYFSDGITTTGVENNAQIRSTVDNANRSNMSIYSVDSRGLVALPPGGNASQWSPKGRAMYTGAAMRTQRSNLSSSQETLTTLSHDTGGMEFQDSNDLSLALKKAQEDTRVYYVMGYFSTNAKEDGKYRKIRVEVNRPDVKVDHRPGYFASKAFAQLNQQERDLQLQQAMAVDKPFTDVPVILEANYFRRDNNTSYVPLSIELKGNGIQFADKGTQKQATFEFLAQAVDPKGRVTGVARDQVQIRLPAESAEKIKAGGILYSTGFQLRPGDYNLKFLVRDNANGKLGSFEEPFTVPSVDLKKLDTSSIILGNRLLNARDAAGVLHQGSMRRFQMAGRNEYDPMVIDGKTIVPSIGNVFMNRQTVYVYFQVYGAAADPQTAKPSIETDLILLKDSTKILESQPQLVQDWTKETISPAFQGRGGPRMGGMGRGRGQPPPAAGNAAPTIVERKGEATVAISLPLKSLKKGAYTLQIHVRDTVADANLFKRVTIVIQ